MIQVDAKPDRVELVSPVRTGTRLWLACLAAIPLLAPYELLFRPQWHDYSSVAFAFAAIISAGALCISVALALAAIAGPSLTITLNAVDSAFTYRASSPLFSLRTTVYALTELTGVAIRTIEWSEGEPSHSLRFTMADGRTFDTASTNSPTDIARAKAAVDDLLGRVRTAQDG